MGEIEIEIEIETVYLAMNSITNPMGTFDITGTWLILSRVELNNYTDGYPEQI